MPQQYVVVRGDCLSGIAADFGFSDYRIIYDDASNAEFRRLRPNPNLIYPGDAINIPDKEGREESRPTDAKHDFEVTSEPLFLQLRMRYNNRNVIASKPYELKVEGQAPVLGTTDGEGFLKARIPNLARSGTLLIEGCTYLLNIAALNPTEDVPDDGTSGIQQRLKNLGYDPGPIDGIYGPLTAAGVRAFQEDYPPLAVDGICGPLTTAKLKEVHGS